MTQTKTKPVRHNWDKLKQEYLTGDWVSVREFLRDRGISLNNVNQVSGWSREKKELSAKTIEVTKEKLIQGDASEITKIRERQARLARFLQLKGAKVLEKEGLDITPDDARKMVVAGLQEERKAVGIEGSGGDKGNTSLTQININGPKTNLDKLVESLDYEGLLGLIADLKRERTRRFIPASATNSSGEVQEGKII